QDNLLQHLRTLRHEVEATFAPRHLIEERSSTLGAMDRLLRRADFEQSKSLQAAGHMLAELADIGRAPQV
ncbi:hypothetical protein WDZ92_47560, partial [Nostoc sp. NIES-2111]